MPTTDTTIVIKGGSLYGTGRNNYGQLTGTYTGNKSELTEFVMSMDVKPKYIACGSTHTVVLMTDGSLYGTGNNGYGQLTRATPSPYKITELTEFEMPTLSAGVKPKYIACGSTHTVVLMTDGSLYGTGYNGYGQLGLGDTTNKSSLTQIPMPTLSAGVKPKYIACGSGHTIVLMTDGSLYGTGDNGYGQLTGSGDKRVLTKIEMPTIPAGLKPKYIACGGFHTVVLMTDGSLYGTGYNAYGQLTGTGNKSSLTKIDMPTLSDGSKPTPKYIACGSLYTVVLMTDGSLYGTGYNLNGQLTGTGNKSELTEFVTTTMSMDVKPKYIACGSTHTVVLMTDGSLYGTGYNYYGQLTLSGTKRSLTSISDGVSYIADMMDYVDDAIYKHNYTVYFMKSIQI